MKLRYPLALLLIVGFFAAGENDYENEVMEEQQYIERVCDGVHTNYLNLELTCARP
jgi:hypothetical protein